MTTTQEAITELYNSLDVPCPGPDWPVAPLGPLLARLPIRCIELPALTCQSAQDYLLRCGALGERLALDDAAQEHDPLAGFAYQGGECAFLFVNGDDPVVRRRFSMAHELGHYVLHFRPTLLRWREALAAGEDITAYVFDAFTQRDVENAEDDDRGQDYVQREREADDFAASLLLPPDLVASRSAALRDVFLTDRAGLEERLAMEFLVSRAAMRRRLSDIKNDSFKVSSPDLNNPHLNSLRNGGQRS
jgi:Zn-dependent peptidase ImmA (M78 family)